MGKFGLKSITVKLNGKTKEYTSADYCITNGVAYISKDKIFNDFATKTPSEACYEFIASYEGFSATAYRGVDAQNLTIGYGHVLKLGEFANYKNGITESQAMDLLKSDVSSVVNDLNNFCKENDVYLNQQQYDALISLCYNSGGGILEKDSDLAAAIISGDNYAIAEQMSGYRKVNGQVVKGLENRRRNEVEILTKGDYKCDY